MKKYDIFGLLLFSVLLLGLSIYGVLSGSYYVQTFLNLDIVFMLARIALVVALFSYVFISSLRTHTTRALLFVGGICIFMFGAISVVSSTFMGQSISYVRLGDSILLLEAGILSIILSVDFALRRFRFSTRGFNAEQLYTPTHQSKISVRTSTSNPIKTLKGRPLLTTPSARA